MESVAFHYWLVEKYPLIVVDAVEEEPQANPGGTDLSRPNPNGLYDNLYVDMKWIIRPSFRPEGKAIPSTFQEIFQRIFDYIDQLFAIVRPRKLLYLAVDGVLPRSKMNLHRAHCFQAATDATKLSFEEDKLSKDFETICQLSASKKVIEHYDPNIIAPGTEFMDSLTVAVKYYVRLRINYDPSWRNVKVIFSDASVPGDGEHKIVSYIRLQRNLPGYDANTRHCLFGLDADLLMLALATHEVHLSILHKAVVHHTINNEPFSSSQHGSLVEVCNVYTKSKENTIIDNCRCKFPTPKRAYQFMQLWILREYLEDDLHIPDALTEIDFERLIDDFVFMCFLAGGEFLPQIPVLGIQEGPMTLLMDIYKKEFMKMGGYLTESGEANLKRIEHFIQAVSTLEDDFIQKQVNSKAHVNNSCTKLSHAMNKDNKVNIGELGWRERYYAEKFGTQTAEAVQDIKRELVLKYTEGLCWILRYYYQGICSWQWYYPYHYAPFASDLKDLDELEITFFLGKPFKPFEYLMGILPSASSDVLPEQYGRLMTDPNSPISDFYPHNFDIDIDGKNYISRVVARLPFIDETRLLAETRKIEQTLTESESRRNVEGFDILFLSCFHPLAPHIFSLYACNENGTDQHGIRMKEIDPVVSEGINGFVALCDEDPCPTTVVSPIVWMSNISNNYVLCVLYKCPANHRHVARPVSGVTIPDKVVIKKEIRLDLPRSLVADISKDLHEGGRLLLKTELMNKAATVRETLSHSSQLSGCEGGLPGVPSREPLKLSPKSRAAGPPGFEHVVPTSVSSTMPRNSSPTRILNENQNGSKSLPSQVDSSSPSSMLSQQQTRGTNIPSSFTVTPNVTSSFSPPKPSNENEFASPLTVKSTVSQVAAGGHSPNENLAQGYNIPTYISSSTGSSVAPSNLSPNKDVTQSYNASKTMAALQGGRLISQFPSFTPSSNHHQIMHRPPMGQQGFPGFVPRGGPQAQHMQMRPLGHPQQPGPMPPHLWNTERGAGPSPPQFFPHGQHIGAAHYTVPDNRPGNFARGRGMGPRHPNAVFH
ncbi:hypothetical protein O6H91_03G047800 [Diphasiastrum complanatum]|uniref:Uncharacterized protein n=1 Tax=Diphasiastrum complanatum TaxID=34168 RepID=A0ACC2E6D6_DIPCM|nr:hypothetical protein O6H91_03G047800 [Diphasiastrum complanatum]